MNDTKIILTPEEADSLMPKGREVHTFSNPAGMLLGCDQSRKSLLILFKQHAPELAHPPIPSRSCDWCALIDGQEEDGPKGWGATKQEALQDLVNEIKETAE